MIKWIGIIIRTEKDELSTEIEEWSVYCICISDTGEIDRTKVKRYDKRDMRKA